MILTCPSCTVRYVVAEGAIGPNGRTVRCASCGHQWYEKAEVGLDESLFEPMDIDFNETAERDEETDFDSILRKEMEIDPIPAGVLPPPREDDPILAQLGPRPKKTLPKIPGKWAGYASAAAVWCFIFAAIFYFQPAISRAWPASNLLYTMAGFEPSQPGAGLALENLNAQMLESGIRMTGDIRNTQSVDKPVPAVMAIITGHEGERIEEMLIAPPVVRLKPGGKASFNVAYPRLPDGAENVSFAFSFISVKPAAVKE
jgi:predicted Zn finger-like uncharacterized protein